MTKTAHFSSIVVNGALEEMARVSGADIADILACMATDPAGNTAKRFREYVALGVKTITEMGA